MPTSTTRRLGLRKTSLWIAIAVGLAAAAAIWFGGGALWRFFLAMHHVH